MGHYVKTIYKMKDGVTPHSRTIHPRKRFFKPCFKLLGLPSTLSVSQLITYEPKVLLANSLSRHY